MEEKRNEAESREALFSKRQLMSSSRFWDRRDLLEALLDEKELYTKPSGIDLRFLYRLMQVQHTPTKMGVETLWRQKGNKISIAHQTSPLTASLLN